MNARERFAAALRHEETARIPFNLLLYKELADQLNDELGPDADYRDHYREDVRLVPLDYPEYKEIRLEDDYFPLPTKEALDDARRECEAVKEAGLVTSNTYIPGIFEHIKAFTDDEFALTHMMLEPEDMHLKITAVTDWLSRLYELLAGVGYDICFNGDDIGTQRSTIMSVDCLREFYLPNHKRLIEAIKSKNPAAVVAFHCCGHIHTLLPEWIGIGLDIIQSIQPEANDLQMLKDTYGDRIVFWGALGLQSEMFYLSIPEAEDKVRQTLNLMGRGGGYIASTSNYATGEVSIERIKAVYRVLNERQAGA